MKAFKTLLATFLAFCWLVQARVVHVGVTSEGDVTVDIESKSEGQRGQSHGNGITDNPRHRENTQRAEIGPKDVDLESYWHRGFLSKAWSCIVGTVRTAVPYHCTIGLMHKTGEKGVDIVLNSLSGELLHACWKCVAEFGKLVELGKRDLVACGQLDMQPFLANRSYCCVDITQFIRDKPEKRGRMLERCLDLYRQKKPGPFSQLPFSTHASRHQDARRYSQIKVRPRAHPISFDPQASYILTGGLGGLGKAIAIWLVHRGARNLEFLSRSAGLTDDSKEFFAELESMGCHVPAIAGIPQSLADVEAAISKATGPVKGLFHVAMALQDAPILDMTQADWIAASQPKVDGTSLVTVVDQPGQGNYNAAITFLEAFCQYRHSLGLPASVLNICPVDGVGFVAENPAARRNMKAQGLYFLGEEELLDFIELSIVNSTPIASSRSSQTSSTVPGLWTSTGQLWMGLCSELHLDYPNNRTNWRQERRMGTYHNVRDMNKTSDASTSSLSSLQTFLSLATEEPDLLKGEDSQEYLAYQIDRKVYDFMLLAQLGLDSLMTVELKRWWKQALGLQISQLEIMATGSLMGLGKIAAEGLQGKIVGTS
ncbi:hypothetical protein EPUS_01127 [Endocarpon pusillum Z07020]|uniref:Uncharacterized protein n=1 Tax=Endocarpon pusillum (strain Z07020 / HMAS-L-300199) TaxID=1263415 RepID=U1HGC8_ENDPU|nr:uncharacterized protein EPUS_01127 [Endocarpon pusillum Z07020]ERF69170.1 hypothetical protein EPUS_01127 [Endocarpon pusillum Z07020]